MTSLDLNITALPAFDAKTNTVATRKGGYRARVVAGTVPAIDLMRSWLHL
jgi:hypothetical protein